MARHILSVRVEVEVDTDYIPDVSIERIKETLAMQAHRAVEGNHSVVKVLHTATVQRRENH